MSERLNTMVPDGTKDKMLKLAEGERKLGELIGRLVDEEYMRQTVNLVKLAERVDALERAVAILTTYAGPQKVCGWVSGRSEGNYTHLRIREYTTKHEGVYNFDIAYDDAPPVGALVEFWCEEERGALYGTDLKVLDDPDGEPWTEKEKNAVRQLWWLTSGDDKGDEMPADFEVEPDVMASVIKAMRAESAGDADTPL